MGVITWIAFVWVPNAEGPEPWPGCYSEGRYDHLPPEQAPPHLDHAIARFHRASGHEQAPHPGEVAGSDASAGGAAIRSTDIPMHWDEEGRGFVLPQLLGESDPSFGLGLSPPWSRTVLPEGQRVAQAGGPFWLGRATGWSSSFSSSSLMGPWSPCGVAT